MGRKIPAKKHRGVKDPEKQRAKRLAELETRTNAPPKDVDEQAIPKSLERVIKLKEAAKAGSLPQRKRKKRRKNALICIGSETPKHLHPKAKPEKVVPVFQQKPDEKPQEFWHRVSRDTHAFLKETAFEKKYNVEVKRDPETGLIEGLTKCKSAKDDLGILLAKHKNIKKKKKMEGENAAKLTKSQKRKQKLDLKNEKKLQNSDNDFGSFHDKVAFGEVAHEPPRLNMKSKETNEQRKPKDLLLNSLFKDVTKIFPVSKMVDRSGKRKNLPAAERRQLEKQRNEAIMAYRKLKLQRLADKNH